MRALMLAAGRGLRLHGQVHDEPPKALLEFGGETLLRRHVRHLRALGIEELVLVVGYRSDDLRSELAAIGARDFARCIENPGFRRGALLSLWTAREVLRKGPLLFMDADVLYAPELLARIHGRPETAVLPVDGAFEPGDDPVMVGVRDGRLAGFGKQVPGRFDAVGEWPGFAKLEADAAARLAAAVEARIAAGEADAAYEPALADVLVGPGSVEVGLVDVSDLPWIEIDFPGDLERARREILPRLDPPG